jgi:hypothetical protein
MKYLLIFTLFIYSSCLGQNNKNNIQNSNANNDSLFIKKGYIKYHSKYHYSFFYSKSWLKLPDDFFRKAVDNSYSKPDPQIYSEVGFTLDNDKKEYIFPKFHLEVGLEAPPTMTVLKKQISVYVDSQFVVKNKNETASPYLVEKLSINSFNSPKIDEDRKIIYMTTIANLQDQGELYILSATFLGKETMVSMKIFIPNKDKDKYLKDIYEMISSFHFDKEFEYK